MFPPDRGCFRFFLHLREGSPVSGVEVVEGLVELPLGQVLEPLASGVGQQLLGVLQLEAAQALLEPPQASSCPGRETMAGKGWSPRGFCITGSFPSVFKLKSDTFRKKQLTSVCAAEEQRDHQSSHWRNGHFKPSYESDRGGTDAHRRGFYSAERAELSCDLCFMMISRLERRRVCVTGAVFDRRRLGRSDRTLHHKHHVLPLAEASSTPSGRHVTSADIPVTFDL